MNHLGIKLIKYTQDLYAKAIKHHGEVVKEFQIKR